MLEKKLVGAWALVREGIARVRDDSPQLCECGADCGCGAECGGKDVMKIAATTENRHLVTISAR